MSTDNRKLDHIRICLEEDVESDKGPGLEDIELVHRSLPQVDLDDIDLGVNFLGKELSCPLLIAGMTGGHEKAYRINRNLAQAAESMGVAMGVGSQRAAIEDPHTVETFSVVREYAPHAFVVGNIGAVQLCDGYGIEEAEKAVDMVDADALAIHINPLQEGVQEEGDVNFSFCLEAIEELCREVSVPLIAKETGAGMAREEAQALERAGVSAIDVGGRGGTSFAAVESYRGEGVGKTFRDWGISTVASILECTSAASTPVIATGGLRNGVHAAKSLALGASLTGYALPLLKPASQGSGEVQKRLERIVRELRTAMFLTGSRDVGELQEAELVVGGKTREWIESRKLKA